MPFVSRLNEIRKRTFAPIERMDGGLIIALVLAFAFSIQGINWGRVEDWNSSEMALAPLNKKFEPAGFFKPPFETYLNHILVLSWVDWIQNQARKRQRRQWRHLKLHGAARPVKVNFNELALLSSRFLTLALFLGSLSLEFAIARRFFGLVAARVTALLMATSAGFIVANHFLTADSPMIFWMLLAFLFCQRILQSDELKNYLLAGFLAGIATATKYNALVIGLAIPMAHLLKSASIKAALFDRRTVLGVLAVPAGFLVGCPYAVLDHRKFIEDFMYNYVAAPHYSGEVSGNSYLDIPMMRIPEIIGWPGTIFVALAVFGALILVVLRKPPAASIQGFLLAGSVVALYYFKMGSFPRMETRFILPIVPVLFLMMGPFLEFCPGIPLVILMIPITVYNCICSFYVGIRFEDDPRMAAQTWVRTHLARGTSIESAACPDWNRLPDVDLDMRKGPRIDTRGPMFTRMFGDNQWIMDKVTKPKSTAADFTLEALQKRNPEYMAVACDPSGAGTGPDVEFYNNLLEGRFPYAIVFDLQWPPIPDFIYPKYIDLFGNRITILHRVAQPPAAASTPQR